MTCVCVLSWASPLLHYRFTFDGCKGSDHHKQRIINFIQQLHEMSSYDSSHEDRCKKPPTFLVCVCVWSGCGRRDLCERDWKLCWTKIFSNNQIVRCLIWIDCVIVHGCYWPMPIGLSPLVAGSVVVYGRMGVAGLHLWIKYNSALVIVDHLHYQTIFIYTQCDALTWLVFKHRLD